ncbi:MAG: DUF3817 domain-containing protein [Myxococcus sp.]|nr:DUF3817 domain-containing protein [Myxococcus sp.]
MFSSDLGRFRLISGLEGLSYVLLVGIAMPLKYVWGDPSWVRVMGALHGGLFVAFCVALGLVVLRRGWPLTQAATVFGLSLLPLGALVIEKRLRALPAA